MKTRRRAPMCGRRDLQIADCRDVMGDVYCDPAGDEQFIDEDLACGSSHCIDCTGAQNSHRQLPETLGASTCDAQGAHALD